MGTDNLFHKRKKAKSARELSRRAPRRDAYDRILIVCEGEKTEPTYFEDLKDHYSLNSANVEVTGECGSGPHCVFQFAVQKFQGSVSEGNTFDRVYCVIDRDAHDSYDSVLQEISSMEPRETFFAASSVPCFEYWLLLHFEHRAAPYAPLPGRSVGNQVERDLKKYMPEYRKSCRGVFAQLLGQLEQAKAFAARTLAQAERAETDNPSTKVHVLVSDLQSLKERSRA
ncbi:MAG: RloB domain-containing protein [Gammaproteobacteria bacterium]|nr:MAG: RloB domain-containing protein [Gammaproteobacteria bacterium]